MHESPSNITWRHHRYGNSEASGASLVFDERRWHLLATQCKGFELTHLSVTVFYGRVILLHKYPLHKLYCLKQIQEQVKCKISLTTGTTSLKPTTAAKPGLRTYRRWHK